MSKRTFPWIIGLAAVALLGLILMQLTWIDAAIELEESRFAQRVQDAMQRVVDNTEQLEIAAKIASFIDSDDLIDAAAQDLDIDDSVGNRPTTLRDSSARTAMQVLRIVSSRLQNINLDLGRYKDSILEDENFEVEVYRDEIHDSIIVHQNLENGLTSMQYAEGEDSNPNVASHPRGRVLAPQQNISTDVSAELEWYSEDIYAESTAPGESQHLQIIQEFKSGDSSIRMIIGVPPTQETARAHSQTGGTRATPNKRVRAIARSSDKLLQELHSARMAVHERIDTAVLREELRAELQRRGVTVPFSMSIESPDQAFRAEVTDTPDSPATKAHQADTDSRVYQALLFPSDVVRSSEVLHLTFPDQQQQILLSMGLNLGASLLFLLLLIGCFAFTVYALLRQKKISDIKTDFINNMTHEFKTPISTISLASEALLEPAVVDNGKRVKRFAHVIYAENKRLEHQVERALQAALMDRGQLKLHLQTIDMHSLLRAATDTLRIRLEPVGGTITLALEANQAELPGDAVHIENVIHNLLDNAEKYSAEAPQISVRTFNRKDSFFLEIADRGLGLSREARKRIFDKFYRVPTGNVHDVKGFGLGLSYVRDIVTAHFGTLDVRSELGEGTTFIIELPLTDLEHASLNNSVNNSERSSVNGMPAASTDGENSHLANGQFHMGEK